MGNKVYLVQSQETTVFDQNKPLEQQLEYLGGQYFHDLERIELYKLKNEITKLPSIFEKQHANTNGDEEQILLATHQELEQLKHPNLVKYYGLCIDSDLTANLFISKWYFEALWKTLKSVSAHHFSYKSLIPERDLWKMLQQITSALYFLEARKLRHSYIQPDSIYVDQRGQIKLIPQGILRMMSGYSQVMIKQGKALLSPELIEQLKLKNINPVHNPIKSDVYSLGMTFLELMTLKNSFDCYSFDLNNPFIRDTIVEERIIEATNNGYSEDLIQVTKNMLHKDENYRISFYDILNFKGLKQHLQNQQDQYTPLRCSANISPNRQKQMIVPPPQPSIPAVTLSPVKQQVQLQNLYSNPGKDRGQEMLRKEQEVNLQLQFQLKQQQQMLQQQYQQQQQQQLIIDQQQSQMFQIQQQIEKLSAQIHQQPKPQEQQKNQTANQNYFIAPMQTPPITFSSPIKHNLDDFTEHIEIQNRVSQALAQSRQAIGKYQQ